MAPAPQWARIQAGDYAETGATGDGARSRSGCHRPYVAQAPDPLQWPHLDETPVVVPDGKRIPFRSDRTPLAIPSTGPSVVDDASRVGTRPRGWRGRITDPITVALALATLAAASVAPWSLLAQRTVAPTPAFSQFEVELRHGGSLGSGVGTAAVLSRDGTRFAYVAFGSDRVARLNTLQLSEPETVVLVGTDGPRGPFFSPDGRRLAMSMVDGGSGSLVFFDQVGDRATRRSNSVAQHGRPLWTPDWRFVVMNGPAGIAWASVDSTTPHQLMRGGVMQLPWSFTPNGDRIAYHEMDPASGFDLWTAPVRADARGLHAGTLQLYLRTASYEVYPGFSTDGRWLAYASDESGPWELYVRRFLDDGTKVQVVERRRPDIAMVEERARAVLQHLRPAPDGRAVLDEWQFVRRRTSSCVDAGSSRGHRRAA